MTPSLQDYMEGEGSWEHLSHGITSEDLTRKTSVALRHLVTTTFSSVLPVYYYNEVLHFKLGINFLKYLFKKQK